MIIISLSLRGRNDIHVRFIRRSYRNRGRVARDKTKIPLIIVVFIIVISIGRWLSVWVVVIVTSKDMNKIFIYSAMKIKANRPPEYSVLNPDTNSLSPSAKSNGARLVSASIVVSHININIGIINKMLMAIFIVRS